MPEHCAVGTCPREPDTYMQRGVVTLALCSKHAPAYRRLGYDDARMCTYCDLPIEHGDRCLPDRTGKFWAHVTCWYDGGPFEREMLATNDA